MRVSGNTVVVNGLNKNDPEYRAGVGQNFNNFNYIADITTPADQRLRDLAGNQCEYSGSALQQVLEVRANIFAQRHQSAVPGERHGGRQPVDVDLRRPA